MIRPAPPFASKVSVSRYVTTNILLGASIGNLAFSNPLRYLRGRPTRPLAQEGNTQPIGWFHDHYRILQSEVAAETQGWAEVRSPTSSHLEFEMDNVTSHR